MHSSEFPGVTDPNKLMRLRAAQSSYSDVATLISSPVLNDIEARLVESLGLSDIRAVAIWRLFDHASEMAERYQAVSSEFERNPNFVPWDSVLDHPLLPEVIKFQQISNHHRQLASLTTTHGLALQLVGAQLEPGKQPTALVTFNQAVVSGGRTIYVDSTKNNVPRGVSVGVLCVNPPNPYYGHPGQIYLSIGLPTAIGTPGYQEVGITPQEVVVGTMYADDFREQLPRYHQINSRTASSS